MSKTKAKIFVFIILALAGLMFFGCEQKPIVEDINFLDDEINLLVGERFTPTVEVYPTYSSDYYLISSDENIVKINGKEIEAISQGNALIKVRATQNEAIESAINVTVLNEPSKIKTPSLSFNEATQQIYISPVPYANDYTLVVNENEFNVAETQIDLQGLVNRFSADLLTLKVKANAAAGSKVFESSDWSGEYCVFAISNASIKAGKLSFDVRDDVNYIISLDDETLPTLTLQDGVDLTALDPKFAGKNVNVKIAGEFKTKSEGVTYFGNSINLPLNVLPAFSAQFSGNVISWADADVNFNITIKNLGSVFETATAENNSFNLTNLTKFNLIEAEAVYTVLVEPVVDEFVFNTATTETKIEVEFSKKAAPVLSTLNNTILWDGTDNYEINEQHNGKTTTTVSSANQIKFDGKESGQYVVTVSAMAGQDNGIYYLASDNAQIEITKQAEVSLTYANLKDHVLTFDSEAEDEYLVYIDDIAHTITSGENKENKFSVNFKTFKDFYIASGRHTIYVKHLGKPMGEGQACFDSEPSGIAFTQLEEILNINMAEQTASVEKTLVNQSAQISFVVSDGENTKTYDGDSVYIDTDDEFYQTKTYSICVKVEGDGVHTFSVFNDAMAKREFTVLDCPTLKVLDAATMQVNFDAISNAYGYNITLNGGEFKNNFTNNYFNIEIYEGQTLNFAARTVGDGVDYFNSKMSEAISVSKLKSATIKYNSEQSKLTANNPNAEAGVLSSKPYTVKLNGNEVDFNSTLNLIANERTGENTITVITNAKVGEGYNFYLNSDEQTIIINKIYEKSNYEIEDSYKLKITPFNHTAQYILALKIKIDGKDYNFEQSANNLVADGISLPFSYDGNSYVVTLQNNYKNILPITNNFTVQVMYKTNSTGNDIVAFSNFDAEQEISLISAPNVLRENQEILISNLETRKIENYKLLLNGEVLDSFEGVANNDYIRINIDNLTNLLEENSLQAIILNPEPNGKLTIANMSGEFKFRRLPKTELVASKNNGGEDNSVVLSYSAQLDGIEADIKYILTAYQKQADSTNEIKSMQFTTASNSIRVDDITDANDYEGIIYFTLKLLSSASFEDVQLFDSLVSDEVELEKLITCNNVGVDGNNLTFSIASEFVAGYDVYKQLESGQYEKINKELILTNEFDLQNEVGSFNVVVRAVAVGSAGAVKYTNSNLSSPINITKIGKPDVKTENGEIVVYLPADVQALLKDDNANCYIIVKNVTTNKTFKLALTSESLREKTHYESYIIDPSSVLNYNDLAGQLSREQFTFAIQIEPAEETSSYFINSNELAYEAYGVFAPLNLNKQSSPTEDDESLDSINWQPNEQNKLNEEDVNSGYVFKLTYDEETYYSYDDKLKYKEGENYYSYNLIIANNSIKFPYGYDADGNGRVDDSEVVFKAGAYSFAVRSVPSARTDVNLLCSVYSYSYEFTILNEPNVYVVKGSLAWDGQANATSYKVTVYNHDFTSIINRYSLAAETTLFDFSNPDFTDGLYAVTVQAISTKSNVLNSRTTEKLYVYRMQTANAVLIDDGSIVIEANKFFNYAELEFVDANNRITKFEYNNTEFADSQMTTLSSIASFKSATEKEIAILTATRKYIITINDSAVLSLLQGGNYSVNVRLRGNNNANLPIISSSQATNLSSLTATKLKTSLTQVGKGQFKFLINTNDININSPITTTLDLNYNFKGETNEFLNHAPFYKIVVSITNTTTHTKNDYEIYALDYYAFKSEIDKPNSLLKANENYVLNEFDGLYGKFIYKIGDSSIFFNIFENNTINLNSDSVFYYPINCTLNKETGSYTYSSSNYATIPVAQGGTISLAASVLGGDSVENLGYLTSDYSNAENFTRYEEITATGESGLLKFRNLQPTRDGGVIDYPVYELRIYKNGVMSNPTIIYLYYSGKEEEAKKITGNTNNLYLEITNKEISDYIIYDISRYLDVGDNVIRIKTLAGYGTGSSAEEANYLLDAKDPTTEYTCYKLGDVIFALENGELAANVAYTNNRRTNYANYYEITLESGDAAFAKYVININDKSNPNVRVEGNKFYYIVPKNPAAGFNLQPNASYSVKVRAMGGDNANLINGDYYKTADEDFVLNFQKIDGLSEQEGAAITVKDGALSWVNTTENPNITLKITAQDTVGQIYTILVPLSNESSYKLLDTYSVVGSREQITLDGSQTLLVQIMVRGNSVNLVSSDYSNAVKVIRLNRIENSSIVSYNGVLTWAAVDNAKNYTIEIQGADNKTYLSDKAEFSFDDIDLPVGNYYVYITANGNDSVLTSARSLATRQFVKLDVVKSVSVQGNSITWQDVNSAQGYKVNLVYTGPDGGEINHIETVTENQLVLPDNLSGAFTIKIRAVGYEEGFVFNGNEAEFENEIVRPQPIGEIYYDAAHSVYYWTAPTDAQDGDSFIISYTVQKFKLQGGDIVTESALVSETTSYKTYNNYYYFEPTTMGIYTSVSVKVVRGGVYSSIKTFSASQTINMFSAGEGTDSEPYLIKTAQELLNVSLKPNMKFKLIETINFASLQEEIISRIANGYLIANEFSGTLYGNNNAILLPSMEINDVNSFGLFNKLLSQATVCDLTIGENSQPTNITINANNLTGNMFYGVLAAQINNATIKNVNINNVVINLAGSTQEAPSIYLGAIAGKAENVTIEGALVGSADYVGFTVNYGLSTIGTSYIAGLIGEAINSNITLYNVDSSSTKNSTVNFVLTSTSSSRINSVAGAVAHFKADNNSYGIKNCEVTINFEGINPINLGGIVANAEKLTIESCTVTGKISESRSGRELNVGGMVAIGNNVTISNTKCNVNFEFNLLNLNNIYLGVVAGKLTNNSTVTACTTNIQNVAEQTSISGTKVNLGAVGNKDGNCQVELNYLNG